MVTVNIDKLTSHIFFICSFVLLDLLFLLLLFWTQFTFEFTFRICFLNSGKIDLSPSAGGAVKYTDIAKEDAANTAGGFDQDAVSALVNLGYSRSDAFTAVSKAKPKANDNLEDLIRVALKELSA